MANNNKISFYKFFKKFPDEESARHYFEQERWVNQVVSALIAEVREQRSKRTTSLYPTGARIAVSISVSGQRVSWQKAMYLFTSGCLPVSY